MDTAYSDNNNINLVLLAEECAEVIQAVSKIQRFGINECHPRCPGYSNRDNLETGIAGMAAIIDNLVNKKVVSEARLESLMKRKLNKLNESYTINDE